MYCILTFAFRSFFLQVACFILNIYCCIIPKGGMRTIYVACLCLDENVHEQCQRLKLYVQTPIGSHKKRYSSLSDLINV